MPSSGPPHPARRRGQGDRPRAVRRGLPARRTAPRLSSCAARTRTPASSASTPPRPRRCPGVKAVVTAADFPAGARPHGRSGRGRDAAAATSAATSWPRQGALRGHAVAAVAAASLHIAEEAAGLIEVDYEALPCVLTAPEAMQEGAPILHEDLKTEGARRADRPRRATSPSTSATCWATSKQGFAEADVVVEREFDTATVHQGYIEPHDRHRAVEQRRPRADLVQHAGRVRGPRRHRLRARPAGVAA